MTADDEWAGRMKRRTRPRCSIQSIVRVHQEKAVGRRGRGTIVTGRNARLRNLRYSFSCLVTGDSTNSRLGIQPRSSIVSTTISNMEDRA